MSAKLRAAIAMFLGATSLLAQSPAPVTAPADQPAVAAGDASTSPRTRARPFPSRRARAQNPMPPNQHLQEMETTLKSMHTLLNQMQAKAAASKSKDPVASANLQMWELMLTHLDNQFEQLRMATLAREDLDARRAALYNQAYSKATREARDAAAVKGQTPPAPSAVPASPKP